MTHQSRVCSYALTLLISLPHRSQGYTFIAFRATKGYAEEATDAIYLLHVSFFKFSANNLIVGLPSWIAREYLDDLFCRLVSSRSEKYFASSSTGLIWLPQYRALQHNSDQPAASQLNNDVEQSMRTVWLQMRMVLTHYIWPELMVHQRGGK